MFGLAGPVPAPEGQCLRLARSRNIFFVWRLYDEVNEVQ